MSDTAVIVLAAGNSTRMGVPKQTLEFKGQALLRYCVEMALSAACGPVVVVLGSQERQIRRVLLNLPVEISINERWSEGMGTSIQAGLQAIRSRDIHGAILMLADQPFVSSDYLRRLVKRHFETGEPIVASRYAGTAGVPVFFERDAFPLLESLAPAQGCKSVILANAHHCVFEDCPEAVFDIDTPEDYRRATTART